MTEELNFYRIRTIEHENFKLTVTFDDGTHFGFSGLSAETCFKQIAEIVQKAYETEKEFRQWLQKKYESDQRIDGLFEVGVYPKE